MILGIVGSEEAKFTAAGRARAKQAISELIWEHRPAAVSSGHCHLGGIDIWAEEIARDEGCYNADYIFRPRARNWEGYKARNIQIARASDLVVCLSVDTLPETFQGMRHPLCYHCARHEVGGGVNHVKSGGCYTRWYAESIGKRGALFVVNNFRDGKITNL